MTIGKNDNPSAGFKTRPAPPQPMSAKLSDDPWLLLGAYADCVASQEGVLLTDDPRMKAAHENYLRTDPKMRPRL